MATWCYGLSRGLFDTDMNITIEPLQLLNARQGMAQREKKIHDGFETILKKAVFIVNGYVKMESPVDTGRLRASVGGGKFTGGSYPSGSGITIEKSIATVSPTVEYAKYVNASNPFMNRAAKRSLPDIKKIVQDEVNKAIK